MWQKIKKVIMSPLWFFMHMISNSNEVSINRTLALYCIIMATIVTFQSISIEYLYGWFGMAAVLLGLKATEKISFNKADIQKTLLNKE